MLQSVGKSVCLLFSELCPFFIFFCLKLISQFSSYLNFTAHDPNVWLRVVTSLYSIFFLIAGLADEWVERSPSTRHRGESREPCPMCSVRLWKRIQGSSLQGTFEGVDWPVPLIWQWVIFLSCDLCTWLTWYKWKCEIFARLVDDISYLIFLTV